MALLLQLRPLMPADSSAPTYGEIDAQIMAKLFPKPAQDALARANQLLQPFALSVVPGYDSVQTSVRGAEAVENNVPFWTLKFAQTDIVILDSHIALHSKEIGKDLSAHTSKVRAIQTASADGTISIILEFDSMPVKGRPFGSDEAYGRFTITKSPDGQVRVRGSYLDIDEEAQKVDYTYQVRPLGDGLLFVSGPHPDSPNETVDHTFKPSN